MRKIRMKEISLKNNEKINISAKKCNHKLPFIISLVSMGILSFIFVLVYFCMHNKLEFNAWVVLSLGLFFFVIFIILLVSFLIIHLNRNSPLVLTDARIFIYSRQNGYAAIDLKDLISWTHRVVKSYTTLRLKSGMDFAGVFYFEANGQKYKTLRIKNYQEVISVLNNIRIS